MLSPLKQKKITDFKEKIGMIWRILQRGELTPKKLHNFGRNRLAMLLRKPDIQGYPSLIMIEPTNICNIACTFCETGRGITKRPKNFLPFEKHKKIVDEVSEYALFLFLYYIGEPFEHPQIYDMIRYAHKKKLSVYTSTNGLLIDTEEKAGKLVESGLDTLLVSFTGLDEESYKLTMRGGSFHKLVNNLKLISQEKKKRKSKTPIVKLRFMIMKHNEKDVHKLKDFAAEVGGDIINIRAIWVQYKNDTIKEYVPKGSIYARYDIKDGEIQYKTLNKGRCEWLWLGGIIGMDGKALPCCIGFNEDTQLGDIEKEGSYKAVWNNEHYRKLRQEILDKKFITMPHCEGCSGTLGYQDFS